MAASAFRKESLRTTFRRVSQVGLGNGIQGSNVFDAQSSEPEIISWSNCQEIVVRLLQANKIETQEKISVAASVRHLINHNNLANLLCESIQRQLLPQAFKGLVADVASANNPVKQLATCWILVYTHILPEFQIIFYSLTECTKFDAKKVLLTAFRDALLLGYPVIESKLITTDSLPSAVRQMLLVLEYTTRDSSELFNKLESSCCKLIDGYVSMNFLQTDVVDVDEHNDLSQKSTTPVSQSLPKSPVFKTYSRVTWAKNVHDGDNSARRHSSAQCSTVP